MAEDDRGSYIMCVYSYYLDAITTLLNTKKHSYSLVLQKAKKIDGNVHNEVNFMP